MGRYVGLIALCLGLGLHAAHAKGYRWTATSTTSMAITGNIVVSANRIQFGNGAAVGLNSTGVRGVFTLHPPGVNPVLLHGNRLCGDEPPTYLTIEQAGRSLALYVYNGSIMPGSPGADMCASYRYER
ncbi:hypothetical protein AUC68_07485 [Methyloceanibacter methanicus]|uniref:Uncharacterized protein n=1 Tax=Methyloceanibacter methanicus TaxID=1774968 RepID=A0A1E3VZL5_9HYPH|nr:hypothetical protein [Methyloceanibacter methanicus]ODR98988.1 hypothetical protein AUC68_07485 [Methyloceanibacter methanicus]